MKCHQRLIREKLLKDDLETIGFDITQEPILSYELEKADYNQTHKKFVETYEWLGSVGNSPKWVFTGSCQQNLAGTVMLNEPANYSKNLLHTPTKQMECLIQRGACASWAHPHLGSKLIRFACRWMTHNTSKKVFVAYSDPTANEIGTIYQACGFDYLGSSFGTRCHYIHPDYPKPFSMQSLRRTSTLKKWLKGKNIPWDKNWQKPNGFKDLTKIPPDLIREWYDWGLDIVRHSQKIKIPSKGKYVLVLGKDKREQKYLNKLKKYVSKPYPKRI